MRVVKKSVINELILGAEEHLKSEQAKSFGKWVHGPDAIKFMIEDLEELRKQIEEKVIDVKGGEHEKTIIVDSDDGINGQI